MLQFFKKIYFIEAELIYNFFVLIIAYSFSALISTQLK